jgi:transcription elongation GreA/GreB family factor
LAFARNMSRAFIKESDSDNLVNAFPERIHSDAPNYITRSGLERLQAKVHQLETELTALNTSPSIDKPSQIERIKQDLRYHRERLRRAVPTDTPEAPDSVQFGVTVILVGKDNDSYQFTLVGEDETDLESGRISWTSPIARLLMDHKMGDEVRWNRGDETLNVEITCLHGIVQGDLITRP